MAFIKRLKEAAGRLRYFPLAGWTVEEPYLPDHREIVFQNYRIIYQYDGSEVVVVTVVHGSYTLRPDRLSD